MLERLMHRRRAWVVMLLGLLLGALAIGVLGEAENDPSPTDSAPVGAQSTTVTELEQQFSAEDESTAIVLFSSPDRLGEEALGGLQRTYAELLEGSGGPPVGPPERSSARIGPRRSGSSRWRGPVRPRSPTRWRGCARGWTRGSRTG